jgi:hypothetical protein
MQSRVPSGQRCNQALVKAFDYSGLAVEFTALSKPAQRALIGNGILTVHDLSRRTLEEVSALHGIGPSSIPVLREALRKHRLTFAKSR